MAATYSIANLTKVITSLGTSSTALSVQASAKTALQRTTSAVKNAAVKLAKDPVTLDEVKIAMEAIGDSLTADEITEIDAIIAAP